MVKILTNREKQIIDKKLSGRSLTQNESNILSKTIRPKLIEISKIDSNNLLQMLEYNQKARAIENKIKEIVLMHLKNIEAIIVCGSAIQTNYKNYNDIDLIIATKKTLAKNKKGEIAEKIEKSGRDEGLNLDVQIYSKHSIITQYSNNPSLIYQLKDHKVIHGKIKLLKKAEVSKLNLRMKLDWSDGLDINSSGDEIIYAIRNALLVLFLINRKVDNYALRNSVKMLLGQDLIDKLGEDIASKNEKSLALMYLKLLINNIETELKNAKWEKRVIENL